MGCGSFEPAVRYAGLPVGSVLQRLTRLPGAIEVKLLRKSENRTAAEEREGKGKGGGRNEMSFEAERADRREQEEEEGT